MGPSCRINRKRVAGQLRNRETASPPWAPAWDCARPSARKNKGTPTRPREIRCSRRTDWPRRPSRSRSSRTINSVASAARGSANACCHPGNRSSDPHKRANERRHQQRRTMRIHQAKSHLLEKCARLLDRPDGLAIQPPFLAPHLLEFEISHASCESRVLSREQKPSQTRDSGLGTRFS